MRFHDGADSLLDLLLCALWAHQPSHSVVDFGRLGVHRQDTDSCVELLGGGFASPVGSNELTVLCWQIGAEAFEVALCLEFPCQGSSDDHHRLRGRSRAPLAGADTLQDMDGGRAVLDTRPVEELRVIVSCL